MSTAASPLERRPAQHPIKPRVPRYQIAEQRVLERIARGDYAVGERLEGIDKLANNLGVSASTMRQSLQSLAAKGILECVPGRGTSVSSGAMDIIRGPSGTGQGRAYSLIIPDIRFLEFSTLAHSVQEVVRDQQIELMICNAEDDVARYQQELERTIRNGSKGIILVPPLKATLPLESLVQLKESQIPVVTCYRPIEVLSTPSVLQDVFAAQRDAADYLIRTGCQHLGLVYVGPNSAVNSRFFREGLHGHKHAIMEHKLDYCERFVLNFDITGLNYEQWAESFASPSHGEEAGPQEQRIAYVMQWLKDNPFIDGVVCYNDYLAPLVAEAAKRLGRAVPDDLSIIARGSIGYQMYTPQPVTMMDVNLPEFGRRACDLLGRMAAGEEFAPDYFETVGATLVPRGTTRPLPEPRA